MEKLKLPSIVLGTWSWGTGAVGGDQVFGNHVGVEELKPVFDEAMAGGLNLWDSAVVYGMGHRKAYSPRSPKNAIVKMCSSQRSSRPRLPETLPIP